MASAETQQPSGRGSTLGYGMVLLGVALFVTSCFLPYEGFVSPASPTVSLYELLTFVPNGGSSDIAVLLYLFGGVAFVTAIAILGLARGERRATLPSMLVGAVVAWSLTASGALLRNGTYDVSLEVGFWMQAVSIGLAVMGTILVATRRRGAHERAAAGI